MDWFCFRNLRADVCFLRFINHNCLNKDVFDTEKMSKNAEKQVNKGVIVFIDEVFQSAKKGGLTEKLP